MRKNDMDTIRQLIGEGKVQEAIRLLDEHLRQHASDDEAWYLRGNAYRKTGDHRQALNSYLRAVELNADSPARLAHDHLMDILNYSNPDMYNP